MLNGSYFGEIEIMNKCVRLHTTMAVEDSEFLTLSKPIFESFIKEEYGDIYTEMEDVAGKRLNAIEEARNEAK